MQPVAVREGAMRATAARRRAGEKTLRLRPVSGAGLRAVRGRSMRRIATRQHRMTFLAFP
jgi:hypothetical protein